MTDKLGDHDYLKTLSQHVNEVVKVAKAQLNGTKMNKGQRIAIEQKIYAKLMLESGVCEKCPRTTNLTLDHIIPLSFLAQMGIDVLRDVVPDNYRILCKPCNLFKGDRLDFSTPKTKEILLRLIGEME
jgi:5-methylcytosine-specific restriction endonuclease McrA